ncbi:MAG: MMPL family transporter [Gluconacetobacter diazotrophicus]|nr:MMPL family transporter [Gluconacetobacter diazotrophicus]
MLAAAIVRVVSACVAWPRLCVLLGLLLGAGAGAWGAAHWRVSADELRIMPDDLPWRRNEAAYRRDFPPHGILLRLDAPTAEAAAGAAGALRDALARRTDRFRAVRWPQGDPYLAREALLFRSPAELERTAGRLAAAAPLLEPLAADPSLRGAAGALVFGERAVAAGRVEADALAGPMEALAATLRDVAEGRPGFFSWRTLMDGTDGAASGGADRNRAFLLVDPVLDTNALQPGAAATDAIDRAVRGLDLSGRFGAAVAVTGTVPIDDQQFSTLQQGTGWSTLGTALAVLLILFLALRSPRIIVAVALSLGVGFAVTAAFGLILFGSFNLISVAFAVLFVGLGADFGIQFSVRYRSERFRDDRLAFALRAAAGKAGVPLLLATVSTAAGFLSFVPTAYRGMAELGAVAGIGMAVAFASTITLLPALLVVLKPPGEPDRLGFSALAPIDRALQRHRILVVGGTIAAVVLGSPLLARLRFDMDVTHMQPPQAPAVRAFRALAADPEAAVQAIDVPAPSLDDARRIAVRLRALPEVKGVRTVDALVPEGQDGKLPLVERAARALLPAITPARTAPPPDDAAVRAAVEQAAAGLAPIERGTGNAARAAAAARALHPLLDALARGTAAERERAAAAIVPPLRDDLAFLRAALRPAPVGVADLPPALRREWLAPDGVARVEAIPSGNANDARVLRRFARAVLAVAPDASGVPVSSLGSQRTVVRAFVEAGALAVLSIALILWVTLRRLGDVALTLLPLIVAGLLTLEVTAALDLELNFANIIALPLLLGVGVAFKIYYVSAWRAGGTNLMETALTRAILFSALTTATAFGSLWLSPQPGLSSMGELMALSLFCTLLAAVLFQPALMGPPRQAREEAGSDPKGAGTS